MKNDMKIEVLFKNNSLCAHGRIQEGRGPWILSDPNFTFDVMKVGLDKTK